MRYYKQIDTFRFFAALAVVVAHWLHFIPWIDGLRLGFIGVDLFFVISGFLISYQLLKLKDKNQSHKNSPTKAIISFLCRRSLRIFPLYFIVLILATIFNQGEIRDAFIYNFTYTSNFYFIQEQKWSSIFSHFWSLSVEEHFYLVWPILLLLIRRSLVPFLIVSIATFSLVFRYLSFTSTNDYFAVYIHTFSCLDLFMFGAMLSYLLHRNETQFLNFFSNKNIKILVLLGLLLTYSSLLMFSEESTYIWVFFRFIFGVFCAGLLALLVLGFKGRAALVFENKYLVYGGKLSYAIYLVHNFVPGMLIEIKKLEWPIVIEYIVYLSVTILFSMLLHRFVEMPIRNWSKTLKMTSY